MPSMKMRTKRGDNRIKINKSYFIDCIVHISPFSWSQFSYSAGDNLHQWHHVLDIYIFPTTVVNKAKSPELNILNGKTHEKHN